MTPTLPTGGAGRALALGLLGATMLAAWGAGVAPLLAWHADRAEALAGRRDQARQMAALTEALPELRQAAAARVADSAAPSLLDGGTDAIAGAALQGLVQDMAGRVGATLFSVETLPGATTGNARRIGLRLSFAAPWPVLVRLLQAVEQARPRMVIDDLELHATPMRQGMGQGGEEMLLNAAFTVHAFRGDSGPRPAP